MSQINLIVRALIIHSDHILLLRSTPANGEFSTNLSFLPGGHVEAGEPAAEGLKRELKEELGIDFSIGEFAGALECSWSRKGALYHELDLVFLVSGGSFHLDQAPPSNEKHIQFFWHKLSALGEANLLPRTLVQAIPKWLGQSNGREFLFSEMSFC